MGSESDEIEALVNNHHGHDSRVHEILWSSGSRAEVDRCFSPDPKGKILTKAVH